MRISQKWTRHWGLLVIFAAIAVGIPIWRYASVAADIATNRATLSSQVGARANEAGPANQLLEACRAAASRVLPSVVAIESRSSISQGIDADAGCALLANTAKASGRNNIDPIVNNPDPLNALNSGLEDLLKIKSRYASVHSEHIPVLFELETLNAAVEMTMLGN